MGFVVISPFVIALVAAWFAGRWANRAAVLAAWPALLALIFGRELQQAVERGGRIVELPWAPSLGLTLSFNLDALGLLFALLITGVGTLVVVFASGYLGAHAQAGRFYASLFAFMGAMLGVVLSDNILTLFVFWELTGFTSFFLIGFEHERAAARSAAIQALIVTGAGGLALLAAGVLLGDVTGSLHLSEMATNSPAIRASPLYTAIATLVLAAAFTKSAQVPFHFWLPNAMEAPTPVSAYLHSATMVKAGVYLIARMTPIVGGTPGWTTAVTIAGAVTMVVGAYRSVQETDLKRILAYSTLSALGVMTMLLGVGTTEAIVAALVYLLAHAAYKGALFLIAGAIDHETGTRELTALSGLRRAMPITALAGAAAALSMAGVPLTLGFVGKESLYEALLHAGGGWFPWLLILTVGASVLLGLAGLLAGVLPFRGAPAPDTTAHEPGWQLWLPPVILASAGVIVGVAPFLLNGPLSSATASIGPGAADVSLAAWHGFGTALLLSVMTLLAIAGGYALYLRTRVRAWRPRQGTEDLYQGALAALDAVSRAIGPALHSASLRTYVMVIVTASAVIGGAALITAPGFGTATARTPITLHDAMIIVVIIGGAISAVVARSTMSAVLSLGAVGYGVATIFLSFGAPDLAMTQFSVETLTVLIYALVFRHFRDLGSLSPTLVRVRDALIAVGVGTFIGALVLSVSTTETAPRLREFFAEFAPTLAHGRNIVNVILVDFRAFDTLGEITVLATAAIGVRALQRAAHDPAAPASPALQASPIFQTAARLLMPLLLLFAIFLLLRGHNEPGGGFVAGLIAAAAFALYAIAFGVRRAQDALLVSPLTLLGAGLLIGIVSGLPGIPQGLPFLTAVWSAGGLGSPLLFDVGVFLVVSGVVMMMLFNLAEES